MIFKNKNEKIVVWGGLFLTILVIALTVMRPKISQLVGSDEKKSSSAQNNQNQSQEYAKISAQDAIQKMKGRENPVFLDLRSSDEFQVEHIVDSVNVPPENLNGGNINAPQNAQIIVIASSADQAANAIKIINDKGHDNAKVLSGGLTAWKDAFGQTVSWGDPTSFVNQSKINFISPEDLKKMIDEKQNPFIIDVRQSGYFSPHIAGATNIPVTLLEKRRKEIPLSKEVVVYGQNELEAFHAGVMLYDLNIFSAYVLRGGFSAWTEKNYPAVK